MQGILRIAFHASRKNVQMCVSSTPIWFFNSSTHISVEIFQHALQCPGIYAVL